MLHHAVLRGTLDGDPREQGVSDKMEQFYWPRGVNWTKGH
jgi:hypothetical protein